MEESNFYDLRKQVVQQLRERHYAPLTICAFKSSYNKLECYMLENKIENQLREVPCLNSKEI